MRGAELIARTTSGLSASAPRRMAVPGIGELHTWLVPVKSGSGRIDLLDPVERRRAESLPPSYARDIFVTSRTAQRLVGAGYLGIPPAEATINRDCQHCARGVPHGRPRFADPTIDYSVSHTQDWVLLAVVGVGLVGVDIERRCADRDTDALAAVSLTTAEQTLFTRVPAAERPERFLIAWTRKEAAMKLTGLGLRAAPGRLDVSGPTVRARAVPGWPDLPVHLRDLPAPDGHVAALATTVPVREVRTFTLSAAEG